MITSEIKQELKKKLLETKALLEREIKELKKPVDMGDDVDGGEEEAEETEAFSANIGAIDALKKRLAKVNKALTNMEEGSYGKCKIDDKEIRIELLKANPESEYCKEHILSQQD